MAEDEEAQTGHHRPRTGLDMLFIVASVPFFAYLLYYYYTGAGGATLLAVVMVPYAFILHSLDMLRKGRLYPWLASRLGRWPVYFLAGLFSLMAVVVAVYTYREFWDLIGVRQGSYNRMDVLVGFLALLIVMEYARRRHPALFFFNLFLIAYAVEGWLLPGIFKHPGLSVERVITAMSVEFDTGVFERLSQIGLTVIGAFVLLVSVAQGFGLVESIIRVVSHRFSRSPRMIPQAAVVGSMAVAMVSGSGAANAATTGSITIPLMKRVGFPPHIAASVETASSIGGQLMPPMMGISAFVMADFLGVSYFDVMARGFAPALVYYLGIALTVYLLASRFLSPRSSGETGPAGIGRPTGLDYVKLGVFFSGIGFLIVLMGVFKIASFYAALLASGLVIALTLATMGVFRARGVDVGSLRAQVLGVLDYFASFTSDITLLLATLGIMTGLFTITGVPTKVGFVMLDVGAGNLPLLVLIAFAFGYLVGLGLPPVVTYILTALIVAPYFIEAGVNPWVIHFFAFFMGVFSELSPPTSVTAAVASKIAEAGFMKTMLSAMRVTIPLYLLMFGVFLYPGLVAEPGLGQLGAVFHLLASSLGLSLAVWGGLSQSRVADALLRLALGSLGISALALGWREPLLGAGLAGASLALSLILLWRMRR